MPALTLCGDAWCFSFGSERCGRNDLQVKHWFVFSAMSFYGRQRSTFTKATDNTKGRWAWMNRKVHATWDWKFGASNATVWGRFVSKTMWFGANEQMLALSFAPGEIKKRARVLYMHIHYPPAWRCITMWLTFSQWCARWHNHFNLVHLALYKTFRWKNT